MKQRRRFSTAIVTTVVLFAAWLLWTGLTVAGLHRGLDEQTALPQPTPRSYLEQLLAGISMTTWPGIAYAAIAGMAYWALKHRLRNLALAGALMLLLCPITQALRFGLRLPRPYPSDLILSRGYGYPAEHTVAATACAVMAVATLTLTRRSPKTLNVARGLAILAVVAIAVTRWVLGASSVSQLIGGVLLGGLGASAALLTARVHVPPADAPTPSVPADGRRRRAAVIVNPAKVGDAEAFRRHVTYELKSRGWRAPIWLETTVEDPGVAMVRTAVRKKVDLVLAAGGDGTIRVVCSGLAGTGIPLGLIPAGTTNLLARNLNVPLDESEALRVAFEGVRSQIDLVRVVADDDPRTATHFAVIAGLGVDAAAFANTDENLKKAIGWGAYVVAAARHMGRAAVHANISIDGDPHTEHADAALVAIGNVGFLQGGIEAIPGAVPTDGLLNVLVSNPGSLTEWGGMLADVLLRRENRTTTEDRPGRHVRIELAEERDFQLDGDAVGTCRVLECAVDPMALTIMLAAPLPEPPVAEGPR